MADRPIALAPFDPDGPPLTLRERRKLFGGKKSTPAPSGHVARPGTGPQGETCGSCRHLFRNRRAKVYLKCGLNRARWTSGGKTDVRARDAACSHWAAIDSPASGERG